MIVSMQCACGGVLDFTPEATIPETSSDTHGLILYVEPCGKCIDNAEIRGAESVEEGREYEKQLEGLPR